MNYNLIGRSLFLRTHIEYYLLFFIILRYIYHLKENKNKFYTLVGKRFGNEEKLPASA